MTDSIILAQQDHATSAGPLFIIVVLVLVIGGVGGFALYMMRNNFRSGAEQVQRLARQFDGRPEVYLNKAHWSLDEETIRRVAWDHGYEPGGRLYRAVVFRRVR